MLKSIGFLLLVTVEEVVSNLCQNRLCIVPTLSAYHCGETTVECLVSWFWLYSLVNLLTFPYSKNSLRPFHTCHK